MLSNMEYHASEIFLSRILYSSKSCSAKPFNESGLKKHNEKPQAHNKIFQIRKKYGLFRMIPYQFPQQ